MDFFEYNFQIYQNMQSLKDAILSQKDREITLGEYVNELIEKASKMIEDKNNQIVATQALWDGDTYGWGLHLGLVGKAIPTSRVSQIVFVPAGQEMDVSPIEYGTLGLAWLRFGSDFRAFEGTVPPYPEAWVAQEVGKALEEKYGIPLYFPSPDLPDDDCPNWWDKDKAINCADCGKLIIPTDSPYVSKEVCRHCHLERRRKQEIIENKPESLICTFIADPQKQNINFTTSGFYNPDSYLIDKVLDKNHPQYIDEGVNWIGAEELEKALPKIDKYLLQAIEEYQANMENNIKELKKIKKINERGWFIGYIKEYNFECLGMKYSMELITFKDDNLRHWISTKELFENLISNQGYFIISFRQNIGNRDTEFVAFNRKNEGKATYAQYLAHYQNLLPESEIQLTLNKLVEKQYLDYDGDMYKITLKGYCI
jgi:hypothetical protein